MDKLDTLVDLLSSYGRFALGFSGGVDSTFLAAVASRYAPEQVVLIHVDTPFIATPERESCAREAARTGLPVQTIELDPLGIDSIATNPANRCYHCKQCIFAAIVQRAHELGCTTIIDGSNADDALDYRPGMQALRELGVASPLLETGWHKSEERELLRTWGHEVWNMPAGACLATRVASGERITAHKLEAIRVIEDELHRAGATQVRARLSSGEMRIEASAPDVPIVQNELARLKLLINEPVNESISPYIKGSMNTQAHTDSAT